MRKQNKISIWPVFFDSTKTRKEGRRISKGLAISSPKTSEIIVALEKIGLEYELISEAGHPKTPWLKTGMLLVKKSDEKVRMMRKIAKQLLRIRNST